MNNDYNIKIAALCCNFNDGKKQLSRAEFWKQYQQYGKSIDLMLENNIELANRQVYAASKLDELARKGINFITFMDVQFPTKLLEKIGKLCNPFFFYIGNLNLLNINSVGFVGNRDITAKDKEWCIGCVNSINKTGKGVISGGARGIDSIAMNHSIMNNSFAIEILPGDIDKKLFSKEIRQLISNNSYLGMTIVSPFEQKTQYSFVRNAMERNKYIYALSQVTVVVRSGTSGGTWEGAKEALKSNEKYGDVFCWNNKRYKGNKLLIELGAIPLGNDFKKEVSETKKELAFEQIELL